MLIITFGIGVVVVVADVVVILIALVVKIPKVESKS